MRLSDEQLTAVEATRAACMASRVQIVLSPIEQAEREDAIADWLEDHALDSKIPYRWLDAADAVFVFIGTRPRSEWLPASVLRDSKGFVLAGRELMAAEAFLRVWKERRPPYLLETSTPGILAAGDVRANAMNRVAAAVGEGSMAIRFVHEYLATT